jgi:hypothetical protein
MTTYGVLHKGGKCCHGSQTYHHLNVIFHLTLSPVISAQHHNHVKLTLPRRTLNLCNGPNANYLAQIIELDLIMQFFWLVLTHCASKKQIETLLDCESDFGPKIRPHELFTVTETLDFLTTQKQ